jgi:hypothetical protein
MKPTSHEGRKASTGRSPWLIGLLVCSAVAFWLGNRSASVPDSILAQFDDMRQQILEQQSHVDRLRTGHVRDLNALGVRLAELQAASIRIDALGERLAQMGQLSPEEFSFGGELPVGGPAEPASISFESVGDLALAVDELGQRLRHQSSQLDALQFLMVNRQLERDLTPSGWPIRKGWISSRFGERADPFTGERVQHRGLDFAGVKGTDVLSVASGVVVWAGGRTDYGKTVEIDHGNGYVTRYAHNERIVVQVGDHVAPGQVIAAMGSTGRASAPHVHFEVLKNGARVNPAKFVGKLR